MQRRPISLLSDLSSLRGGSAENGIVVDVVVSIAAGSGDGGMILL
jgi:hypothetical protein